MKRNELSRHEFLSGFMKSVSAFAIGSAISTLSDEAQGGHLLTSRGVKEADSFSRKLPQRVLGRTGVKVSALGMGGAEYFQHVTDKEAVELILNRAIDGGINYFDTARNYERSEENFGLVLSRRRKEVFLATKCEERGYDGALRDVETSLKKLQTDRIDLIQVHHIYDKDDVPALGRKDGVIPALQRLQKEKVVRFIGMTGHPDYLAVKQALTLYDCWDAFMGFINPRASTRPTYDEQLPIALKKHMGIVAMKVFGGSTPAELIGAGRGKAPARQLLRYALSQAITVAIPAVSSLAELEENLEFARAFKPMPAEERESLIARINEQPSENAAL